MGRKITCFLRWLFHDRAPDTALDELLEKHRQALENRRQETQQKSAA